MSTTSQPTHFDSEQSAQRSIKPRGKACLHCRRRKMRCDGVRPACNQCVRADRAGECEYADGESKTGTQLLYERLAELEKRYRELQSRRPASSTANMRNTSNISGVGNDGGLSRSSSRSRGGSRGGGRHGYTFNNYSTDGESGIVPLDTLLQSSSHLTPASVQQTQISRSSSEGTPPHHSVTYTDRGQELRFDTPPFEPSSNYSDPRTIFNPGDGGTIPNVNAPERPLPPTSNFDINELPPSVLDHLIQSFMTHSQQTGLTLLTEDKGRLEGMRGLSNHVMSCIYLWGAHFSPNKSYHSLKEPFLKIALSALPQLLQEPGGSLTNYSSPARPNFRGALALSGMLALYFFSNGRMLEGSYHTNLAVHLAICAGLPHVPCLQTWKSRLSGLPMRDFEAGLSFSANRTAENTSTDLIPYPNTETEALDLHYVLWNIFVLDRSWSAACGFPSSTRWGSVFGGNSASALGEQSMKDTIVTAWPQDRNLLLLNDDTDGETPIARYPQSPPTSTIDDFLMGVDLRPTTSILQMRAKSAALFEASTRLSSSFDENFALDSIVESLRRTIDSFLSMLPPHTIYNTPTTPSYQKSGLFTSYSVAYAAAIRLEFKLADVGYEKGLYTAPMSHLHGSGISEDRGVETVRDTILGYERLHSNYVDPGYQGQQHTTKSGPWAMATESGVINAAVDKCLTTARYITNLVRCIGPEDYEHLEPIASPCWELAGQVFLRELKRLNRIGTQQLERDAIVSEIQTLINGLIYIGRVFPIGGIHAQNLSNGLQRLTANPI